jgi:Ribosomal protein L15E
MLGKYSKLIQENYKDELKQRLIEWRKEPTVKRLERPTKVYKARMLGYKAKQGVIVVRVKVRKGKMEKQRPRSGRRPKRMGVVRLTLKKNLRLIAEEKAQRKFPNMEVLNSYYVAEDGKYKWYEVILVDPFSTSLKKDKDLKWIYRGNVK